MGENDSTRRFYSTMTIIARGVLALLLTLSYSFLPAQEYPGFSRSEIIEEYQGQQYYIHFVKPGQTIYAICRVYHVDEADLVKSNPELKDGLKANQILKVPVLIKPSQQSVTATQQEKPAQMQNKGIMIEKDTLVYYKRHEVKRKETLFSIAQLYNISLDELYLINPMLIGGLKSGQVIKIPVKDPAQFEASYSGMLVINSAVAEPFEIDTVPYDIKDHSGCDTYVYDGESIRVALLLPLYLNEISDINTWDSVSPPSPADYRGFTFIQFYEGTLLALDSLARKGLRIKLYVYDVADDVSAIHKITSGPEFAKMHLIIGPLFKNSFSSVAEYARQHEIPIVNPFTKRNDVVLDNPMVYKVQPSFYAQLSQLVDYFISTYPEANYILLHHNWSEDRDTLNFIREKLSAKVSGQSRISYRDLYKSILEVSADTAFQAFLSDSIYTDDQLVNSQYIAVNPYDSLEVSNRVKDVYFYQDGVSGLIKKLSLVRCNVLISVSTNRAFVADVMSHVQGLSKAYRITMVGMPEWKDFDVDPEHAMKLNLHLFNSAFIDYSDERIKQFIINFRYKYQTEPLQEKYAYDGFDIMFFFLSALQEFGPDFEGCLPYLSYKGLQSGFDFHRQGDGGFENDHVRIFRFGDYRLVPVK